MPRITPPADHSASSAQPVVPQQTTDLDTKPASPRAQRRKARGNAGKGPTAREKELERQLAAANAKLAQNEVRGHVPPVTRTAEVDAQNLFRPQDRPRDMSSTGDARMALAAAEIEPVVGILDFKSLADELAFMEETIEVFVHDSTDQNAEPIVETWCHGRSQFFVRNQRQSVKRKFVEVLARSRTTKYRQQEYVDGNGDKAIRNIPSTALRYPFSVTRDENPRGRAWLEKILQQG